MLTEGQRVRCYHSPTDVWVVREMGVDRDVDVEDAHTIWRLPGGDTLIENSAKPGVYMVCDERFISETHK